MSDERNAQNASENEEVEPKLTMKLLDQRLDALEKQIEKLAETVQALYEWKRG